MFKKYGFNHKVSDIAKTKTLRSQRVSQIRSLVFKYWTQVVHFQDLKFLFET